MHERGQFILPAVLTPEEDAVSTMHCNSTRRRPLCSLQNAPPTCCKGHVARHAAQHSTAQRHCGTRGPHPYLQHPCCLRKRRLIPPHPPGLHPPARPPVYAHHAYRQITSCGSTHVAHLSPHIVPRLSPNPQPPTATPLLRPETARTHTCIPTHPPTLQMPAET